MYEIDLSLSALYLTKIELSGVNNTYLGSKLRRLILSSDTSPENKILIPSEVKALNAAVNLEYFDMRKYKALTAANGLNTLKNLKVFRAGGSGLTTVSFANGAPNHYVELSNGESAQGKKFMDWLKEDVNGNRLSNLEEGKAVSGSSVSCTS